MEVKARAYFKDVYDIFHAERDSFHEIGAANKVVMPEKIDSLETGNTKMRQRIEADQAVNAKYHQVIEHTMSITRSTESDRDDTTLQMQLSAFTASQAQNTDSQFADLRRQLEQCMSRGGGTQPPAVIDTAGNNETQKRRKGPLNDGLE